MIFDYSLAGLVTAALLIYLTYALLRPSGSDGTTNMTVIGWLQILIYCAIIVALAKPLGWYMARVFNAEPTLLSPLLRPVEAALYWSAVSIPNASSIGSPTRSPCCSSTSAALRFSTPCSGYRRSFRTSTRPTSRPCRPISRSTPR